MILTQFQTVGRDLFTRGLVSSNTGNLSVRMGDRLIITRRGGMLGELQEHDVIETGVSKNDRNTPMAAFDLAIHRAIYEQTPRLAVVHAHPPYAITLSLTETEIVPTCAEGKALIGRVPVLSGSTEVSPSALGETIADALKEHRVVLVRGHGSFAVGELLDEAYNCTTALEESAQVICLLRSLQRGASQQVA